MQIDVAKAIKELLFKSESVIIPGLGGLVCSPVSATVDYVQGNVEPPSKKIEFNSNLVINDGVLAHFIEEKYSVSFREAVEAISMFVNEAKEALERREIVELPEVGRIYQDYQQEIRFMPDKTNFAVDSFGLPAVNFAPVVREKEEHPPIPSKATAASNAKAVMPNEEDTSFLKRNMPWLVGISAVLMAVLLFTIFYDNSNSPTVPDTGRVNVSPRDESEQQMPRKDDLADDSGTAQAGDEMQSNGDSVDDNGTDEAGSSSSEQPSTSAAPDVKEAFIVVHSFKNPRNATNFYNVLSKAGYRAEKRFWNGLQRVGIILPYRYTAEIDSMKAVLGPIYKSGPKLFEELEE